MKQRRRRAGVALLRRPALVVTEVVALASAVALAAIVPQEPDAAEIAQLGERWPALARATRALGLHSVLTSGWFLALLALATLSLLAVQVEQWRRVRRLWSARLEPSWFARAQFRRELPLRRPPPAGRLRRSGRAGLLGSPVFHLGLLVVVLAGLARLLFYRDAAVRILEGETLAADPAAWQAQRGGPLSRPFALPAPLRLEEVRPARYESGALQQITARVALLGAPAADVREISINAPIEVDGRSLHVLAGHGPAALLERRSPGGEQPSIVYLEEREQDFRGRLVLEGGREVRLRATVSAARPETVEARLLRGPALLALTALQPGAELPLGGGESLRLVALPWWAQLSGSRDASRPFFFAGVAIAVAGIALLFGVVPVDTAVFVEGDRLVVALRAQRFAPLFAERFDRMCRELEA